MYIWTIFIIYVPASEATAVLIIQPTLVFPGLLVKEEQKRCKLGILNAHLGTLILPIKYLKCLRNQE